MNFGNFSRFPGDQGCVRGMEEGKGMMPQRLRTEGDWIVGRRI